MALFVCFVIIMLCYLLLLCYLLFVIVIMAQSIFFAFALLKYIFCFVLWLKGMA